jgi:predicted membrane-bound spermidine synthase
MVGHIINSFKEKMKISNYKIEIALFVSGAVVMILEIVGSRLLSPYFGNSLYVWTALIGVIMGSLSIGYYYGGRFADRDLSLKNFSTILLIGSVSILFLYLLYISIMSIFVGIANVRLFSVLAAIVLFVPSSIALGMISPYGVRLKLQRIKDSGAMIGSLYALSTCGSIVGTFLAGFVLIGVLGSKNIILLLVVVMAVLALMFLKVSEKRMVIYSLLLICISIMLGFFARSNKTIDIDTAYDRYFIVEGTPIGSSSNARFLTRDYKTADSAVFTDGTNDLVFDYTKYYRLSSYFQPNTKNALMIGGGTFTYPKDYLQKNPDATMTVVEIDKQLLDLAKKYFYFEENDRLDLVFEDGRTYINRNKEKYDTIFMDAYKSNASIPYQLTTRETVIKCYNDLSEDGVILSNIVASLGGERSDFLKAEYRTFSSVFDNVYLFSVGQSSDDKLKNYIMVGIKGMKSYDMKSTDTELNGYLAHRVELPIDFGQNIPILTDDYAPVEQYISGT